MYSEKEEKDYFLIAEIKSVNSSDGFVGVRSHSDSAERFLHLEKVFIDIFGGMRKFIVEDVRIDRQLILIKFLNFDTSEDVSFLVGKKVFVEKTDILKIDEESNTFFIHDLIGCKVVRNDKYIGVLEEVLSLPANDVYVVKDEEGGEILIPAVKDFVLKIDIKNKVLTLVPGKFDIYDDEN